MHSKSIRFLARIYRIWMLRYVDVPEEIPAVLLKAYRMGRAKGRQLAKPLHIPVVAIVNGCSARTTMVSAGGGRYRVPVNSKQRKTAGADAGEVISVDLRLDLASRRLPVPPDLKAGLRQHPKARKAFEVLAPGLRRQVLQYFDSAKSPEARQRRLDRVIDVLLERALIGSNSRKRKKGSRVSQRR
jgi:Bacteriocin-protection, YdeI or OmpD-Associated/Domain of unknown function (DUF1905)